MSRLAMLFLLVAGSLSAAVSTEDVALSGPLPPGYWRTLLHLGADFNHDHLHSRHDGDRDVDFLEAYRGEANQLPYPGLRYELPVAKSADNALVWTAMTNAAADGLWRPHNLDYYIKYWHVYIIVPDAQARPVRFHFRHDDCIRMWVNGRLAISRDGWDHGNVHTQDSTLDAGLNAVTIKLREGGGSDYMAIRVTALDGTDFDDLRYALAPDAYLIESLPVEDVGETTAVLGAYFSVITGRQYTVHAVWGDADHGDALGAWEAHGEVTSIATPASGRLAHPAANLEPDTRYIYRFAVIDGPRSRWTEPVAFKTLGGRPVGHLDGRIDVEGVRVRMSGALTGGARAGCRLHVATADGDWSRDYDFGERLEGPFATNVIGLALDTAYVAHVSVSNAYGIAQSEPVTFRTDRYSDETLTWTGADDSRWENPANWTPDYDLYPRRHDTAVIRNRRSDVLTIALEGDRSVRGMRAGHRDDAAGWTIGSSDSTLRVGIGGLVIRASRHDGRDVTIGSALELEGPAWLALDGSGNSGIRLAGGVSGSGELAISARNGQGVMWVARPWRFTGDLLLRHGERALRVDAEGALSAVRSVTAQQGASVVLAGGAPRLHGGAVVSLRDGGGLRLEGEAAATETIGTLRLGGGLGWVGLDTDAGTPATLVVDQLEQDVASPAVLLVTNEGGRLGGDRRLRVAHDGDDAIVDGALLPFALGWSGDADGPTPDSFLRYDRERGLVPLAPGDYTRLDGGRAFPSLPAVGPVAVRMAVPNDGTLHVELPDGRTVLDAVFIDGAIGEGGGRLQLTGGDELVLRGGMLALAARSGGPAGRVDLVVPQVRFGDPDAVTPGILAVFGASGDGTWQVESRLSGAGGLVVCQAHAGADTVLGGDNRALRGPIVIGGGAGRGIRVTHALALGAGGNDLQLGANTRVIAAVPSDDPGAPVVRSLTGLGTVIGESGFAVGPPAGGGGDNRFRLGQGGRLAPGYDELSGTLTLDRFRSVELGEGTLHIRLDPFTESVSRLAIVNVQDGLTLSGARLAVESGSEMAIGDRFRIVTVGGSAPLRGRFANPDDRVEARHAGWRYLFDIRYIRSPGGGADSAIELVVAEIQPLAIDTLLLVY